MRKINLSLFVSFIAIAMVLSACKKDESPEALTPPAPAVNTYTGTTTDYGMPVTFSTGEVNGETWLMSYAMAVKYALGGATLYEETFSYSSTSGIVKFAENVLQFDSGDGLVIQGDLNETNNTLDGQYNWNYHQNLNHTGNFVTSMK